MASAPDPCNLGALLWSQTGGSRTVDNSPARRTVSSEQLLAELARELRVRLENSSAAALERQILQNAHLELPPVLSKGTSNLVGRIVAGRGKVPRRSRLDAIIGFLGVDSAQSERWRCLARARAVEIRARQAGTFRLRYSGEPALAAVCDGCGVALEVPYTQRHRVSGQGGLYHSHACYTSNQWRRWESVGELGRFLYHELRDSGLTAREFARRLEIDPMTLNRLVHGHAPQLKTIERLRKQCGDRLPAAAEALWTAQTHRQRKAVTPTLGSAERKAGRRARRAGEA